MVGRCEGPLQDGRGRALKRCLVLLLLSPLLDRHGKGQRWGDFGQRIYNSLGGVDDGSVLSHVSVDRDGRCLLLT